MKEIRRIVEAYYRADHDKVSCALAVVIDVEGSAYRRIGARMLVMSDGSWIGGISGGCLEGDALRRAQYAIFKKEPSITTYDTRNDDENQIGVGLGCNGRIDVLFLPVDPSAPDNPIIQLQQIMDSRDENILLTVCQSEGIDFPLGYCENYKADRTKLNLNQEALSLIPELKKRRKSKVVDIEDKRILIEYLPPQLRLIVVGDNYDINTMVTIASEVGWSVTIVGNIKKLDKSICQLAEQIMAYDEVNRIPLDKHTAIVIMSHDYKKDLEALTYFSAWHTSYMGLLGPRKRLDKMIDELKEAGVDTTFRDSPSFFSPLGIDIGAESPEEIAHAAIAEIIAYYKNRTTHSLKFREGPIHERES